MSQTIESLPPLWTLFAAQLDTAIFDYRPQHIADLTSVHIAQVRNYCRQLWPEWGCSQYFLSYDEAIILIQRIARDSRKLPERSDVYQHAQSIGAINDSFPHGDARFGRWLKTLDADRERRRRGGQHVHKVNTQ